jgi:Protein of unknown function (DUF4089)
MIDDPRTPQGKKLLEAYLREALLLAGLRIESEWRDNVQAHFEAIVAAAKLMTEFSLDEHLEPATVFRA